MFQDATALDIAGRLCIVFFFLVAGIGNMTRQKIKDHIDRMAAAHTPLPALQDWPLGQLLTSPMVQPVVHGPLLAMAWPKVLATQAFG